MHASSGEVTKNSKVFENRQNAFYFDIELDNILSRLSLEDIMNRLSPEYYQFWQLHLLANERDVNLIKELSDFSNSLAHESRGLDQEKVFSLKINSLAICNFCNVAYL